MSLAIGFRSIIDTKHPHNTYELWNSKDNLVDDKESNPVFHGLSYACCCIVYRQQLNRTVWVCSISTLDANGLSLFASFSNHLSHF